MKQYYMVLNPRTSYTAFKHPNYESAKTEATRMARNHPGEDFVVLAAIACIKKQDVVIDEVEPDADHIPF